MAPLNLRLITTCLIAAGFFCPAEAQNVPRSFDSNMDPRTVALGEAGTALLGPTDPFTINPAGLADRSGIWLEYERRGMEWLEPWGLEDYGYRSWSGGVSTQAGTFAFTYRRFDQGEFVSQTYDNPQGYTTVKVYDHTFGVAWARPLASWIQAGLAAKLFSPVVGGMSLETTPAYLLDIGIVARSGNLLASGRATDAVSMGVALQNLGSNLRMRQTLSEPFGGGPHVYESSEQMPRTLRLGVAYQIRLVAREPEGWSPLRATFIGDYWNVLNSRSSVNEHYLACGVELTAYELLSIRLGGHIEPFQSVYGREDVAAIRYGVGVDLPFGRFAPGAVPLTLSASYTAIPLYSVGFSGPTFSGSGFFSGAPGTANVFSVTLKYQ